MSNQKQIQGKELKTLYAVMTINVATKDNDKHPSEIQIFYLGKGGIPVSEIDNYFINNMAYERLSDARRLLSNTSRIDDYQSNHIGGWSCKSSIIEIRVEKERE